MTKLTKPGGNEINYIKSENLLQDAKIIIDTAQDYAYKAVNFALVKRNWLLGKRIAEEELPSAYYALYKCYTNGRGVRKNRQLALKYLLKSAELGYPQARKVLKKLEKTQNEQ